MKGFESSYFNSCKIIRLELYLMQTGTIARLMEEKGYGFIKRDGESKDLFFHSSELDGVDFNSLQEGDSVTFEVEEGPKGLNAVKVSKA